MQDKEDQVESKAKLYPLTIESADREEAKTVADESDLQELFFLLVNTCHECFAESLYAKKSKKFKMNVLPEDIMKETVTPQPNTPKRKISSCFKRLCGCFRRSKPKRTILDDVPSQMEDSSVMRQAKATEPGGDCRRRVNDRPEVHAIVGVDSQQPQNPEVDPGKGQILICGLGPYQQSGRQRD